MLSERPMRNSAIILNSFTIFALACTAQAQSPALNAASEGRRSFEGRCSVCHGADGNGGERGPGIAHRVPDLTDAQIKSTILEGLPSKGMPATKVADAEMLPLVAFLRSLRPRRAGFQEYPLKTVLIGGKTLDGTQGGLRETITSEPPAPTPSPANGLARRVNGSKLSGGPDYWLAKRIA